MSYFFNSLLGGNLIRWSWFQFYDKFPGIFPKDKIIVSWDTAMSVTELSDYSACAVLLVRNETVYFLEMIRERLEYPDLKRRVLEVHRRWSTVVGSYALLIENKGSGMSLIQELKRDHIHAIAVDPVGDKVMRMHGQTARIEAGSVLLPRQAPWLDAFKSEILAFPLGRHDDQVDALHKDLHGPFNRRWWYQSAMSLASTRRATTVYHRLYGLGSCRARRRRDRG